VVGVGVGVGVVVAVADGAPVWPPWPARLVVSVALKVGGGAPACPVVAAEAETLVVTRT
jgi:hypothetical protein